MTISIPKLIVLLAGFIFSTSAFSVSPFHTATSASAVRYHLHAADGSSNYQDGEVGAGDNWIEKSFPVKSDEKIDPKKVEDYNLGINGMDFQTGPLSQRMFDAIMSRTSLDASSSEEIRQAFVLYAMDFTAKEAARAALKQNGLDMVLLEEEEDQGMWGDVEAIRLYDAKTGIRFNKMYDSLEEAALQWQPGQPFDFVARQVPAKMKELSVDELLQALDPDGKLREEARASEGDDDGKKISDEEVLSAIFDDDEIQSLEDLANLNIQRTEAAPRGATIESEAYAGNDSPGYRVINRSALLRDSINDDGTENEKSKLLFCSMLQAIYFYAYLSLNSYC
jgi:phosphopantetheinyl transferase (holo-ACP synthase)